MVNVAEVSKILGLMNIINHEADMLGFKTLRYSHFKVIQVNKLYLKHIKYWACH